MTSQPPSPTSELKCTFEELHLSNSRSRKHYQYEDDEEKEDVPQFHYFTLLPTELRLKIYTLSLPAPRIIRIHYHSPATTHSLSRTPSPSPSPSQPTHKRICRPLTITSNFKSDKKEYTGCTSPATIPALLHTCQESRSLAREHYALSFRLSGPAELFIPKIWFSIPPSPSTSTEMMRRAGRPQDILYFPSLPGYCASFKHYTTILSLLPLSTISSITRLAVHEDLFLEENKRRASLDSGIGLGWDVCDSGAINSGGGAVSVGGNGGFGGSAGYWNTDEIIEERLFDFWRSVARKFSGVKEVWIVGAGREQDILTTAREYEGCDESSFWDEDESGSVANETGSGVGKQRENFSEMVGRVLDCVEEEMGRRWVVLRWWVLRGGE